MRAIGLGVWLGCPLAALGGLLWVRPEPSVSVALWLWALTCFGFIGAMIGAASLNRHNQE